MEGGLALLLCKLRQRFQIINNLTLPQTTRSTSYLSIICRTKALISAHMTYSTCMTFFDWEYIPEFYSEIT